MIGRHLAIYFLPFRGGSGQKAAWPELCRIIWYLGSGMIGDSFEFKKRGQLFVGSNDKPLSVITMCVCREKHASELSRHRQSVS